MLDPIKNFELLYHDLNFILKNRKFLIFCGRLV